MIGARAGDDVVVRRRSAFVAGGQRVLALHGLAGSASMWEAWADRLPPRLELWTADLPWGGAPGPVWARDAEIGQWVARAVERVGAPVDVVVAHSFAANAYLALRDAGGLAAPRATVLVAPFYRPDPSAFDWAAISYYLNGFDRILEAGILAQGGGRVRSELSNDMALRVRDRIGPYGWVRFFDTYLRTPSLRPERIDGRTLLLAGDRDLAVPLSDARALAAALPDCRLEVLEGAGHFPMLEQPDRFAALVERFLTAQRAARPAGACLDRRQGE